MVTVKSDPVQEGSRRGGRPTGQGSPQEPDPVQRRRRTKENGPQKDPMRQKGKRSQTEEEEEAAEKVAEGKRSQKGGEEEGRTREKTVAACGHPWTYP